MKKKAPFSSKTFGMLISFILLASSFYPLLFNYNLNKINLTLLTLSFLFFFLSLFFSSLLNYPAYLWYRLGTFLHYVISPIILFIVFILSIVIIGMIMKLFRKDQLKKSFESNIRTYWISKTNKEESFDLKNQF